MSDFWSRRRGAVAAEREAESRAEAEALRAERDADLEAMPEAEALEALGLPAPEALERGDDFAAFLRDEVPAWLRRRALRRLWRVNPALANLDGMIDYGEDYTDAARVVPNLATAYQVGRGMAQHVAALAKAEEAVLPAGNPPSEDDAAETAVSGAEGALPAGNAAEGPVAEPVDIPPAPHEGAPPVVPGVRRMVFVHDSERVGEGPGA